MSRKLDFSVAVCPSIDTNIHVAGKLLLWFYNYSFEN